MKANHTHFLKHAVLLAGVLFPILSHAEPDNYDVVIYGATPAGITASIAASREGMRVALVEPSSHIGGMLSGGLNATDLKEGSAISGIEKEFYQRTARYYAEKYGADSEQLAATMFYPVHPDRTPAGKIPGVKAEPHVCELLFEEMVQAEPTLTLKKDLRFLRANVHEGRIESCVFQQGSGGGEVVLAGKAFIDASYCGDLMPAAGVDFRIGIEAKSEYSESLAPAKPANEVQAYNYRITITNDPANRVEIPRPERYSTNNLDFQWALNREIPKTYAQALWTARTTPLSKSSHWNILPNRKFDANLLPYHGTNWGYPEGPPQLREEIEAAHRDFYLSYLYFVQHDDAIAPEVREEYLQWGLCRDEFPETGHFPNQIYVREGRRLIGEYVMKQMDIESDLTKPDSVGIGDYSFDSKGTQVTRDADGQFTWKYSFEKHLTSAYEIPYRALTPKPGQGKNLLVPVCLSSTQIAWSSLRMEPVFMRMGQAAGIAAAMAVQSEKPVQEIDPQQLREKLKQKDAVVDLKAVTY